MRLSSRWFAHERSTWKNLTIWGYVFLAACALPIPFVDHIPTPLLLVWYALAVIGYLALCVWLTFRIRQSLRLGRADLRRNPRAPRRPTQPNE
jgi:hypothetical protein